MLGEHSKLRGMFWCLVWGLVFQLSGHDFAAEPVKNKPNENHRPEIPAGPGPIVSRPALVPDAKPTPILRRRAINNPLPDIQRLALKRDELAGRVNTMRGSKNFEEQLEFAAAAHDLALQDASLGNFSSAAKLANEALAIFQREPQEKRNLVTCLGTLGWIEMTLGNYSAARVHFNRAVELAKTMPGWEEEHAKGLDDLANLDLSLGDFHSAKELYTQALKLREKTRGEETGELHANLHNLGIVFQRLGDNDRAEEYLRRNLDLTTKATNGKGVPYAHSLETLAYFHSQTANPQEAERRYRGAISAYRLAGAASPATADYARTVNNLGFLLAEQGKLSQAEPLLIQALENRRQILGSKHLEYADGLEDAALLYLAKNDRLKALAHIEESLNISQFHLDLAANVQSERQQLSLSALFRKRLDIFLSLTDDQPELSYTRALPWKSAVFRRQHCMRLARSNPEFRQRFEALSKIAGQISALALTSPSAAQRDAWQREVTELVRNKEAIERQLAPARQRTSDAQNVSFRFDPTTLDATNEVALVDFYLYERTNPTTDVEKRAWQTTKHYVAFVKWGRGIKRVELGPAKAIDDAIHSWRITLSRTTPVNGENDPAIKLRQLIWVPVEAHLANATTVLVSPDGGLNLLPFAALPGKKNGSYLIEELAIAVAPNPLELFQERFQSEKRPAVTEPTLLVLGGVDFDAKVVAPFNSNDITQIASRAAPRTRFGLEARKWTKLAATEGEITMIAKQFRRQFPAGQVTELEDVGATEEAFRKLAPTKTFLHLATHGFFAEQKFVAATATETHGSDDVVGYNPGLLSGLVFAGANQPVDERTDDGILTAIEVAELDFQSVELVTLSACETGLGKESTGEGLMGLQRAFQVAGAKSVVSTLWEVNDDTTRALMERFYENLWKRRMGKLEAMREAQLWMLTEGNSRGLIRDDPKISREERTPPRYWAAFSISGEWR